ncbi:MAG: zinc ribbon domain-containing protein, partial [Vicinamibacteraceae bacterium]|nr:zinc ribbon domain-containing protein [Vicinamibacteraceae bacterium]
MPLYEYQCDRCGHRFETIQKFSDPPVSACPSCGGSVRKLLSSPAIQFKGSGWYITDYARKNGSGAGKSDTATTGTDSATSTASTSGSESSTPSASSSET